MTTPAPSVHPACPPRLVRLLWQTFLSFFLFTLGHAQTLENERLAVTLLPSGSLAVRDKLAGVTWHQSPHHFTIEGTATVADGRLSFRVKAGATFNVAITLADDTLDLTLSGRPTASIQGLEYPGGFTLAPTNAPSSTDTPPPAQTLLVPTATGLAIPFAQRDDPTLARVVGDYETTTLQDGLTMPWLATTDGTVGSLMQLETPYDARFRVWKDASGYHYAALWLDSKGALRTERRVRYTFTATGGAVALCKAYRRHAAAAGLLVTLAEKQKQAPALARFVGALNVYVVDWPDMELFRAMRAAGIEECAVSFQVREKIPEGLGLNHQGRNTCLEAMTREFASELKALGYVAGRYDYYRTIYSPTDISKGSVGWIMRFVGYPEQLALDQHGQIAAGFGNGGRPKDMPPRGHRCSKCQYELGSLYIPVDVERVGYEARFIDAVNAAEWVECYSPAHPVTRNEDQQWRARLLRLAQDHGQVVGTEYAAAWAVPHTAYFEGPTTFNRFFGFAEKFDTSPTRMPAAHQAVQLNEKIRFPLWGLVFHDAAIVTNRWATNPNRYTDPALWDREDLFNVLHGQMPTFMINREHFAEKSARIAQTYREVCAWNREIGFEEMTDFRWLTPDASVQQTTYASGKSITVNFGPADYLTPAGERIAPGGHLKHRP